MLWYYGQMDLVFAPSESTARELEARGIDSARLRVYPRGTDTQLFHPERRGTALFTRYGLGGETTLLYVGRVSKEKNLQLLADAFKLVASAVQNVRLVVVGDGPYLGEMREVLRGWPCTFTGYIQGAELSSVYASCDAFVFPSTSDTFGNVVLEAKASGLPVIVTDMGGPKENVIHGKTGLIVPGDDAHALASAMRELVCDPEKRRQMGLAAREYAEARSFEQAFQETWQMLTEDLPSAPPKVSARNVQQVVAGFPKPTRM